MNKLYGILATAILLFACNVNANISYRSGNLKDDYIEEPLNKHVSKYEKALTVSNIVLDLLKEDNTEEAVKYFDDELKGQLSKEQLDTMVKDVKLYYGNIVQYKQMQWNLHTVKKNKKKYLYSIKIVEHEKRPARYLMIFIDDGKYDKLNGLYVKERTEVLPPGVF